MIKIIIQVEKNGETLIKQEHETFEQLEEELYKVEEVVKKANKEK
jgi:hypothetical protein